MQNTEGGTLTITFLERIVGRNDVFGCPTQATVETVDDEQEAEEANTNRLTFPRIREVEAAFPQCKEALVKNSVGGRIGHPKRTKLK